MSVAHSQPEPVDELYDCNYCEAQYPPDEEYRPGFCSATCEASDRAASVLNIIDHDHRFCNNCFRQIRDVYPPGRSAGSKHIHAHEEWGPEDDPTAYMDDIPDCATGRAYPRSHCEETPNAEVFRATFDGETLQHAPHPELSKQRAVCSCGAMHHRTIIPSLRAPRLAEDYAEHLSETVTQLLHEDKHEYRHDPERLKAELSDAYLNLSPEFQQQQIIRCLGEAISVPSKL